MEGEFLKILGERRPRSSVVHLAPTIAKSLEAIDNRILLLQTHAIEHSTRKGYTTGARSYLKFCLKFDLPLDPSPTTLARYIAYTSQTIASGPKYLTGARHFLQDIYPDFDRNRASAFVQSTIRGSIKLRADPIRRKDPLRLQHLQLFISIANNSMLYDDILFAVVITLAFFACHRIGELVVPNDKSLFDWRKIIKRSSVSIASRRASYHLPYHKGDPFYRGTSIMHMSHATVDPISLLSKYLTLRDQLHGGRTALFLKEDGSFPTRSWFESRLFKLLSRAQFGGHSARSGGATYYAGLGLSEDVIQAIGRWSSATWKIYIRDNPTIRAEMQLASLTRRV